MTESVAPITEGLEDLPREVLEATVTKLARLHMIYVVESGLTTQEELDERVKCGCPHCQYDLAVMTTLGLAQRQSEDVTKH